LCLNAIRKEGMALKFVPENLRTIELCMEAIKSVEMKRASEYK